MDAYEIRHSSDPLGNFNFDDELRSGGTFFERMFENGPPRLGEVPLADVLEPTAVPLPPASFPSALAAFSQPRQQMSGSLGMPAQLPHYGSHGGVLDASEMRVSLPSAGTCETLLAPSSQMHRYSHSSPPTTIQPIHLLDLE